MEYIDTYDANHNFIKTTDITTAHQNGLWHETFHCWIIRPNNKILFQQRSKDNYLNPEKLDISAAGHLTAGDKAIDGLREIKEELGIDISPDKLRFIGILKISHDFDTIQFGRLKDREFAYNYFLQDNTPMEKYILENELLGIYEVDIDELLKLFNNEIEKTIATGYEINGISKSISITKSSFIPEPKEYFIKLGIMAKRFIDNEKYIAF